MALCFEDVVGAVPFTTMFALLVLWFGISVRQPGPPRNVAARCVDVSAICLVFLLLPDSTSAKPGLVILGICRLMDHEHVQRI